MRIDDSSPGSLLLFLALVCLPAPRLCPEPAKFVADARIRFTYAEAIGPEHGVSRRDPSDVLFVDGVYHVWYSRVSAPGAWRYPSGYSAEIYHAISLDGRKWTERGLAISKGEPSSWDEHGVFTPNILRFRDRYFLYYTGVAADHSESTPTRIGVASSDSPDGPWTRFSGNPVLSPSDDPAKFDSMRVDDAAALVRGGQVWLYYKGRQQDRTPRETQMGVAFAPNPLGPFSKFGDATPLHPGHEVMVWPERGGVGSLATAAGPRRFYFAADGLNFEPGPEVQDPPAAPGAFRADGFANNAEGHTLKWGISHARAAGQTDLYLVRFEVIHPDR